MQGRWVFFLVNAADRNRSRQVVSTLCIDLAVGPRSVSASLGSHKPQPLQTVRSVRAFADPLCQF
jgi:hypothetical protein